MVAVGLRVVVVAVVIAGAPGPIRDISSEFKIGSDILTEDCNQTKNGVLMYKRYWQMTKIS